MLCSRRCVGTLEGILVLAGVRVVDGGLVLPRGMRVLPSCILAGSRACRCSRRSIRVSNDLLEADNSMRPVPRQRGILRSREIHTLTRAAGRRAWIVSRPSPGVYV